MNSAFAGNTSEQFQAFLEKTRAGAWKGLDLRPGNETGDFQSGEGGFAAPLPL